MCFAGQLSQKEKPGQFCPGFPRFVPPQVLRREELTYCERMLVLTDVLHVTVGAPTIKWITPSSFAQNKRLPVLTLLGLDWISKVVPSVAVPAPIVKRKPLLPGSALATDNTPSIKPACVESAVVPEIGPRSLRVAVYLPYVEL